MCGTPLPPVLRRQDMSSTKDELFLRFLALGCSFLPCTWWGTIQAVLHSRLPSPVVQKMQPPGFEVSQRARDESCRQRRQADSGPMADKSYFRRGVAYTCSLPDVETRFERLGR